MNAPWLKALLIVSLIANCLVAGFLTRHWLIGQPTVASVPAGPVDRPAAARRGLGPAFHTHQSENIRLRQRLIGLLAQTPPDRERIYALIEEMSRSQAAMQRVVADRIMRDLRDLSPAARTAYLDDLARRMHGHHHDTHGPGNGRRHLHGNGQH